MFSLTVVALVLGSYGMEPAREARFQGSLVAQADVAPLASQDLDSTSPSLELKALGPRPGIGASVVLLTVFGTPFATAATVSIVAAIAVRGWSLVGTLLITAAVGIVTIVPLIIGLVLLPVQLANRRAYDAKVKQLTTPERAFEGHVQGTVIASF